VKAEASAPSNIALIKYMGKTEASGNRPTNASLSYTLEHLRTFVTLESTESADRWEPLPGFAPLQLSATGLTKFLGHFQRLKTLWKLNGHYVIRSANNFPADCGLASSASSFAALTRATFEIARQVHGGMKADAAELSRLSRQGSGSSCRSFFSPWAVWRDEGAEALDLNLNLHHAVILVASGVKSVSSSEAHRRVATSELFTGRPARAEKRLKALTEDLGKGEWQSAFELCWNEFWDMHALFETSRPPFGYMTEESLAVLNHFRSVWEKSGDGPIVTMDAGPNVHLLLRDDQLSAAEEWIAKWAHMKSWGSAK
jgi:diphosphomevalonate decarboxylase